MGCVSMNSWYFAFGHHVQNVPLSLSNDMTDYQQKKKVLKYFTFFCFDRNLKHEKLLLCSLLWCGFETSHIWDFYSLSYYWMTFYWRLLSSNFWNLRPVEFSFGEECFFLFIIDFKGIQTIFAINLLIFFFKTK